MTNNMLISWLLDTDSYKLSHWKQYPPATSYMESFFESRGGEGDYILFFGLQYYMKKFLTKRITVNMVHEAKRFAKAHGVPFNTAGWLYITACGVIATLVAAGFKVYFDRQEKAEVN